MYLSRLTAIDKGIMELSFPRTFAPKSESTIGGTFAPWYFRSLELSFPGTFAPGCESYMELSLPGTFVPWNFRPAPIRETCNRRSQHKRM